VRFSVLLPTRNRLDLLRYAVESVRRQNYADWEIVISDNDSSEDVGGYVASLGDPRIRWVRTDQFLPVTDNWNNALLNSIGDYVVMLGDDDCLLQNYFSTMSELIEQYSEPEAVYVEALQFAYPGVMPGHRKGFIQTGHSDLLKGRSEPFVLARQEALDAVQKSMSFRLSFSYNMQHSLISRRLIERLSAHGPLFQSPYPDYYASNVMMLESAEILMVPEPMVAIGISPRSFGYYYFNGRVDEGTEMLGSFSPSLVPAAVRSSLLPGNPLLSAWFVSMACVALNYGRVHPVRVNVGRYRYLQVSFAVQAEGLRAIRRFWNLLTWGERIRFSARLAAVRIPSRLMPERIRKQFVNRAVRIESPWPVFDPQLKTVEYQTILELFEAMPPRTAALTHSTSQLSEL
jgi:hypothetical protein